MDRHEYAAGVQRRVLLVEDDPSIGQAVGDALTSAGYEVDWQTNGGGATDAFSATVPDLVLLDAGLPDIDGFSLCRWMREQQYELPIVLVTARDSDIDIVVGLDAGASDYVTKPFSMSVLLARVRAHLRSAQQNDAEAAIDIGRVSIDAGAYLATLDGQPVDLRPREFELLVHLARQAGRVVTREKLLSDVWDVHWESSSKTLDMHVMALRRKFGEALEVSTVRGVGYRLESA